MTYQPYPTGGASNVTQQAPQLGQKPQSVRIAVVLMYAGAAVSAVSLILTLVLSSRIKSAVGTAVRKVKTTTPLTAAQIHSIENAYVVVAVIVLLIGIGLWVWMAWANGRGRGWARIVATVFFGLDTLELLSVLVRGGAGTSAILVGVGWLIGAAALIFLWRSDTSQYIAQTRSARSL